MKRIGVSMRSCPAESYVEARDGLARDWFSLLHFLGWNWLLVPNLGMKTADYAQAQGIEALILTGGANLGMIRFVIKVNSCYCSTQQSMNCRCWGLSWYADNVSVSRRESHIGAKD